MYYLLPFYCRLYTATVTNLISGVNSARFHMKNVKASKLCRTETESAPKFAISFCMKNFIAKSDACDLKPKMTGQIVKCTTAMKIYYLPSFIIGISPAKSIENFEMIKLQAAQPWPCLS